MAYELVDRRRTAPVDDDAWYDPDEPELELESEHEHGPDERPSAWGAFGVDRGSGSPGLADHQAALLLINAAVEEMARTMARPVSRRTIRWHTHSGEKSRRVESPSSSTRDGAQRRPERNLKVYLFCEVLGLSTAEAGRRVGITRQSALLARRKGARLALAFAKSRPDPRKAT